jgi:arylsulfatase A-like enzyme
MIRSKFLFAGLGLISLPVLHVEARQKPNVVFILADDLGYGDLSCFGQEKFQTPNIDRLALEGMRCTHTYAGSTVSAPSRACLLTGLHGGHAPIRGNKELEPEGQFPLPAGAYTLFHLFKDAGYTTGAFGKWGLGQPGSSGDPNRQGVDEFFGYNCQLLAHNYYPDHLWHNRTRVELPENANGNFGTYSQDLIQQHTLRFIEENKSKPFFLYVPLVKQYGGEEGPTRTVSGYIGHIEMDSEMYIFGIYETKPYGAER